MADQTPADAHLTLAATILPTPAGDDAPIRIQIAQAGVTRPIFNEPAGIELPATMLRAGIDAGVFDGAGVYFVHDDGPRNPQQLAGVTAGARWDDEAGAVVGDIHPYSNAAGRDLEALAADFRRHREHGIPQPDVGVSLDALFSVQRLATGRPPRATTIKQLNSLDIVHSPAANGRILFAASRQAAALSTPSQGGTPMPPEDVLDLLADSGLSEDVRARLASAEYEDEAALQAAIDAARPDPPADPDPSAPSANGDEQARAWLATVRTEAVQQRIANSDLPAPTRARLAAATYRTPQELEQAIGAARSELAALAEDETVQLGGQPPRGGRVAGMLDSMDRIQLATSALLSGTRPEQGVRPLSGIRELYMLLSGDYEMTGHFHPERVQLASVSSSTMAGLVANALNKRVVNLFAEYPIWWEQAVTPEDFPSLQDARWITLGGVGELPTVPEKQAYTELTWDDQTETDPFVKKGAYVGITLEAIDKDDTRQLQAAPRALSQAAWLTLGKAIAAIFTANSDTGPTMSDSNNLFDASNHSNLGSSALSTASIRATKIAMMKQTELNSDERLGAITAPYYYWVPIDLEDAAVVELASANEPGTADNDINPYAEGDAREARLAMARRRIITVPFWTDANNWAAQANPMLYPSIGLGYRFGRTPEIFSVADPNAGLMFTNDVMPVKVRWFFAVGPTDWRGLYKHNVS